MKIQSLVEDLIGSNPPIGVRAFDGTRMGPTNPVASLVINSPNALRRIITRPGELGFARSFVSGDVDIEGDIFEFMNLQAKLPKVQLTHKQVIKAWGSKTSMARKPFPCRFDQPGTGPYASMTK